MRLLNATPGHTSLFWVTSRPRRDDWRATVILKASYRLQPGRPDLTPATQPLGASGDDPAVPDKPLRYPSDFVPYKPKADFIVVGEAHAPGGVAAPVCRVSTALGAWRKSLAVFGDRHWTFGPAGLRPSDPIPFERCALDYTRAYGGPGHRPNPLGRGAAARDAMMLPNVESPGRLIAQPFDSPVPAGFGPIPPTWPQRLGHAGSYDAQWLKTRFPWFPRDFAWDFFNAAPVDQQMPYLRGDEPFACENLHPHAAILRGRLPNVAARAFIQRTQAAGGAFAEVAMKLDTFWLDATQGDAVLVWRGVAPVRSPRLPDVAFLCATLESLDAPRDVEAHRAAFAASMAEAGPAGDGDRAAAASARAAEVAAHRAAVRARIDKAQADAAAIHRTAQGFLQLAAMRRKGMPAKPPAGDPMVALQQAIDTIARKDPARGDILRARMAEVEQRLDRLDARAGLSPPWTLERVQAALAGDRKLVRAKLDGLRLDGLDLTEADLTEATLSGASLCDATLVRARLAGADLRRCDLSRTSFEGADLTRANLEDSLLRGSSFAGACIAGASFARLDLARADFVAATGDAPDFSEALLERANFASAALPRADFSRARAAGANFTKAVLPSASFLGTQAPGIVMSGAELTNMRASDQADFTGGDFTGVRAPASAWQKARLDGANFSRALLRRAQFPEATLRGTLLDRADLAESNFDDAVLADAVLTNANLLRACFERADLTRCRMDGSNLYSAGLLDAELEGASVRGSFLVRTLLSRA